MPQKKPFPEDFDKAATILRAVRQTRSWNSDSIAMSQQDVAKACRVSRSSISLWEKGQLPWNDRNTLLRLIYGYRLLRIEANELLMLLRQIELTELEWNRHGNPVNEAFPIISEVTLLQVKQASAFPVSDAGLRQEPIAVSIHENDIVQVILLRRYSHYRDLGPLGKSFQDPHVHLLSWFNGRDLVTITTGYKAITSESEGSLSRYLGNPAGEGMIIPDFDTLPGECYEGSLIKDENNQIWGKLKNLVVFEEFVQQYGDTPLQAKALAIQKDGFLILSNEEYDTMLKREYSICVPLMAALETQGKEWIDELQTIPVTGVEDWVENNYAEIKDWFQSIGIENDRNNVNKRQIRRVLLTHLDHHVFAELLGF